MNTPPVDFSYVYELSGNDGRYIYELISLFLSAVPDKLGNLENNIHTTVNLQQIEEDAHFLKSSAAIIRIRDMHADLVVIEAQAKGKADMQEIRKRFENIKNNFKEALPVLMAEKEKHWPAE